MQEEGDEKYAAKGWKTVWEMTEGDEEGSVIKKKKPLDFEVAITSPGRYKFKTETNDIRVPKKRFPCKITITLDLIDEDDSPVAQEQILVDERCKVFKLYFNIGPDEVPRKLKISARCGALAKGVKFYGSFQKEVPFDETDTTAWVTDNVVDRMLQNQKLKARMEAVFDQWPDNEGPDATALKFDHTLTLQELQKDSKFKKKAFEAGAIRPFLLLVSMHPKARFKIGLSLKLNVVEQRFFGDSHAEANYLLFTNRKGLIARTNKAFRETLNVLANNCNWLETIDRVGRKAFVERIGVKKNQSVSSGSRKVLKEKTKSGKYKEGLEKCQDPRNPDLLVAEEVFLSCLFEVVFSSVGDEEEQRESLAEALKSTKAGELRDRLKDMGFTRDDVLDVGVGGAIQGGGNTMKGGLYEWSKRLREGRMGDVAGVAVPLTIGTVTSIVTGSIAILPPIMITRGIANAVFKSTPGHLVPFVSTLLFHRLFLALAAICIDDYYGYTVVKGKVVPL
eukprot:CAMPEP_0174262360 /NCGR_PEP_ID=MMETSP0439-20130205/12930_1 /TAXON_ID=0 /ORGANISM="Stereomyxa ramosa, Strain Chinc5" /LENGTH=505 /DNA_ID=CAMNT_0015347055 /DNA_START=14 /DNA_END=1531 /DNA_ORIENTATION=+